MKLFLCGGGSGKEIIEALNVFSELLDKNKQVLYIPLAMDFERYDDCYNWFKEEMKLINVNKFEMIRSFLELSKKRLINYSAIFIGGGNTYKLLKELKKYNNFEKIENYIKNDGIVFGGSAGAIIFGKNIDSTYIEDTNLVNLKDSKGFDYLRGYSILCHLNKKNLKKNLNYLKEYSIKNKLIYLSEDNVIYINDDEFKFFGESDYLIFEGGNYITKGGKTKI